MANFIPKQYKKEPITVRFPTEKLEKVDEYAKEFSISRSEFINQCIDFAFEHMTESDENKEKG